MKVKTLKPAVGGYDNKVGTILDLKEEDARPLIEGGYAEEYKGEPKKETGKKTSKDGE